MNDPKSGWADEEDGHEVDEGVVFDEQHVVGRPVVANEVKIEDIFEGEVVVNAGELSRDVLANTHFNLEKFEDDELKKKLNRSFDIVEEVLTKRRMKFKDLSEANQIVAVLAAEVLQKML